MDCRVRHVGEAENVKYAILWYIYTPADDKVKPSDYISKNFITRYWRQVRAKHNAKVIENKEQGQKERTPSTVLYFQARVWPYSNCKRIHTRGTWCCYRWFVKERRRTVRPHRRLESKVTVAGYRTPMIVDVCKEAKLGYNSVQNSRLCVMNVQWFYTTTIETPNEMYTMTVDIFIR